MFKKTLAAVLFATVCANADAALSPGDIALIGWIDNGMTDSFAFVTLAPVGTGEIVYFTDSGWTGSQFRGASASDGDGNENLLQWTANADIAAGTIVRSTDYSVASWTWVRSGAIPGAASGNFSDLSLSQTGDQISAFQGLSDNPLNNPTVHLFLLDDTGAFESATTTGTGDVPTGLTSGVTAISFNQNGSGKNFMGVSASVLAGPAKSSQQWLATFADASNWSFGSAGTLPAGSIPIAAVPEPETYALMLTGLGLLGWAARRRRA
jgi:hypothetical protein